MKILALNQVYKALLSSSTENAQFPLGNIKDDRRTKVFRTTESSGWIVFDFGESVKIDSFCIVDNNQVGFSFNSFSFALNNSNAWGSPLYQSNVTLDDKNGIGFLFFEKISARYARIEFESTEQFCEISNLFIGSSQNEVFPIYPIRYNPANRANISINRFGQKFIDEIASQKNISLDFAFLTNDEMEGFFETLDYNSNTIPLFIVFDCTNISNDKNRLSGFYYLKGSPQPEFVLGNFWNLSLEFEEAM